MRVNINGVDVEGTPEETANLLNIMSQAGLKTKKEQDNESIPYVPRRKSKLGSMEEVLAMLRAGKSPKQIAKEYDVSLNTVYNKFAKRGTSMTEQLMGEKYVADINTSINQKYTPEQKKLIKSFAGKRKTKRKSRKRKRSHKPITNEDIHYVRSLLNSQGDSMNIKRQIAKALERTIPSINNIVSRIRTGKYDDVIKGVTRKRLTHTEKDTIIKEYFSNGNSISRIAKLVNRPTGTVYNIISRHKNNKSFASKLLSPGGR